MSLVYKVHKVVPKAFSKGVLLQRSPTDGPAEKVHKVNALIIRKLC